jgi:uncharacterized protein (UPF0297 family)
MEVDMARFDDTMQFAIDRDDAENPVKDIIMQVCDAMDEKGYDPINQIVGYIISGDPTYVTSHKNARSIIKHVERDELLEEIVGKYIENLVK